MGTIVDESARLVLRKITKRGASSTEEKALRIRQFLLSNIQILDSNSHYGKTYVQRGIRE